MLAMSWMSVMNLGCCVTKPSGLFCVWLCTDEPFAEVPDGLDHQMQQDDQNHDEQQPRSGGRLVAGEHGG
jgi:hypothetical protein